MSHDALKAAQIIQTKTRLRPKLAITIGSGLGKLVDEVQNPVIIPYEQLPGFPKIHVKGHEGEIVIGELSGITVACLKGRAHFYEGFGNETICTMIRTLKCLGCETLFLTNAAASTRHEVGPGRLVMIKDHINYQFESPLVGPNDESFGPRFPDMNNAYDAALRNKMLIIAKKFNIDLPQGVYLGVLGPAYETPAEINMFKQLGGDLVGMSTVADVLVARHCGLKVIAISTVTNLGAGLSDEILNHENVVKTANLASAHLLKLIHGFCEHYQ